MPTPVTGSAEVPLPGTQEPQDARPRQQGEPRVPLSRRVAEVEIQQWLTCGMLLLAAVLWSVSLPMTDFRHMGTYGLLDKFPPLFYLSFVPLTAGFVISLRRAGTAPWWPAVYCIALLVAIKAPTAILYDAVRYPWASKHDAVVHHMLRLGELHPHEALSGNMSAYDQWPGFFTLNAGLVKTFGVTSTASYLNWASIVYGVLVIPVLVLIYRTFTEDWRLVWTGVWIFEVANWVGQDYFSPQGLSYILYLAILAVVLRHFVRPGSAGSLRSRHHLDPAAAAIPPPTTVRQRAVCVAIIAPLIAAINFSHQLTPVMLCVALVALSLTKRYRNWGLLVVTGIIMLIWDLTMGRPLFIETMESLKESAGNLLNNSRPGYAGELTGAGPVLQGRANVVMVLAVVALAAAALLLRRRLVRSALPLLLVSAAPVPMFAVNDYGGEMLFRVYLFGLPGAAFFAAAALVPAAANTGRHKVAYRRITTVALPLALAALVVGFFPSYYGKEQSYYTPPAETAMVTKAIEHAPKDALILSATGSYPMALDRYDELEHWFFVEQEEPENIKMLKDPAGYLGKQISKGTTAIVILTRTQETFTAAEGLLPAGGFAELRSKLEASPKYHVIDRNAYGVVLEYRA
ncbi:hypothetical protein [Streptomyces sp. NPDC050738]|uniref:hypothetical protein n=1 Tax=Streptomyces sp. NPDC050738 TaxID=3154744 RepID=UPI00342ED2FE